LQTVAFWPEQVNCPQLPQGTPGFWFAGITVHPPHSFSDGPSQVMPPPRSGSSMAAQAQTEPGQKPQGSPSVTGSGPQKPQMLLTSPAQVVLEPSALHCQVPHEPHGSPGTPVSGPQPPHRLSL
jgi:hypothetical protein